MVIVANIIDQLTGAVVVQIDAHIMIEMVFGTGDAFSQAKLC